MSDVIKFQAPFERLKSFETSSEISLHKAIITQAIVDATNISDLSEARKLEMEAKAWIFGGNESFKEICMEAGMEPSFVIRITKEFIRLHKSNHKTKEHFARKRKNKNIVGSGEHIDKKLKFII